MYCCILKESSGFLWFPEILFVHLGINDLKIKVMKVRLTNPFLAICGIALSIFNMFIGGSIFTYFLFGACFGLIFLNYRERKINS
jgi:hypothetical protein